MQHWLSWVFKEQLMNIRQTAVGVAAAVILCLALCFPAWAETASSGEASFKLTEQSLDNLRQEGLPNEIVEKLEALKDQKFHTEDEFLEAVRQEIGNDQTGRYKAQILQQAADDIAEMKRTIEQLDQRVKELETEKAAQEDATRAIIRDALSTLGSKINESVALGGTLEVLAGSAETFQGPSAKVLRLNTAELDFEIQPNEWTLGTLIIEYIDGTNVIFPTTDGFEAGVDRINLDQGFLTIGDPQRFPPFLTGGRMIVPFGISTGDPVADVLTIEDPLTIEVFETKQDAILIGVGLPTPPLTPATPPVTPPRVRPLVINPLISSFSRALGHKPRPPQPLTPITPTPAPPLFNAGIYFFNGETARRLNRDWRPTDNMGATLGFRTKGNCGRPLDQLGGSFFCPWSIDVDVDYTNSVFDSLFLETEYQHFLSQIGFVPGAAASLKATLGPTSLVAEWNGAISNAIFTDDLGKQVSLEPSAWQITLGYQFDWNPWVEVIGAQGNYITIGYSQTHDLAGVKRLFQEEHITIGNAPKRRFLVSVGEWVMDNVKVAVEYSHNVDYPKEEGGTGHDANGFFLAITAVW
jgi:hypothetical protein